jgi:hypothetical protein
MNRTSTSTMILFITAVLMIGAACSGGASKSGAEAGSSAAASNASNESLKKSPKDSMAHQFELLKAGDTDKLKECFTERLRERITPEAVEKGKSEAGNYTLDDLVGSVEMGQAEGQQTAKIMMKNGRTLTTLVQTDGKWLADTIWFK